MPIAVRNWFSLDTTISVALANIGAKNIAENVINAIKIADKILRFIMQFLLCGLIQANDKLMEEL